MFTSKNVNFKQTNALEEEPQCHLLMACLIEPLMLIFVAAEDAKRETNKLTDDQCFDKSKRSPHYAHLLLRNLS